MIGGSAYYLLKKYNEAFAEYSEAIKINPQNDEAYIFRGKAFHILEKYNEAIADYSEAIKIKPQNDEAYIIRG